MLRRWSNIRPGTQRLMGQASSLFDDNRWFLLVLLFLLALYWLLVSSLERVDLSATLADWWQAIVPLPMPQFVVGLIEIIHPRVLRHFIPVLVGWSLAYEAAVSLVRVLYDLPDRPAARRFLSRLLSSGLGVRPVLLDSQTLAAERENSVLLRVGGPGLVAIKNGNVAVTELNGRFSRVLGPGVHNLGRLEYVRAVLDLRRQTRSAEDVAATTKDGIAVQASVSVTFRLSTGGETSTRSQPYPYDEEAIRLAAYAETVGEEGKVTTWDQIPLGRARGILAGIIASKYRLDEVLFPSTPASEPYYDIRQELMRKLRASLAEVGIELITVHIGRLELPDTVSQQYVEYWQAHWKSRMRLNLAEGFANAVEEKEIARAEAEVTMIQAIIEGVRRAQYSGSPAAMREIIALRLIEALEKMARQSQELHPLPEDLLPQLREFHQHLLPQARTPEPEEPSEQ